MELPKDKVDAYGIGLRIRELRKENQLKQIELSMKIGVDRTSLSSYENGKRLPDITMLCRIADVFEVTLDTLVGRR